MAFPILSIALFSSESRAFLDRPPQILEARQAGASVRLLWALGGDADGALNTDVVAYTVRRKIGAGPWEDVITFDARGMTFEEDIASLTAPQLRSWWDQRPGLTYQVYAWTAPPDVATSSSNEVVVTPELPAWIQEVHGGSARLAWIPSEAPAGYPVHRGYVVQKWVVGAGWQNQTGYLQDLSYIDPQTPSPASYRVFTVYQQAAPGTLQSWRASNMQTIALQPMCEGQAANPYPLKVIEIDDQDGDGYDGDDIAHALQVCAQERYEDLGSPRGDGDGIYEPVNGEALLSGGCVLRALPVTYENVAIMLPDVAQRCDDRNGRPSSTWTGDVTHPIHCLVLDFPAGLVIEGHGVETVFRSPFWWPNEDGQYRPAPVLDFYHRDYQITIRNLVLDGRKHEQVSPNFSDASTWHHFGFRVSTSEFAREILGDGVGNEGSLYGLGPPVTPYHICDYEACVEKTGPHVGDGDGRCEAGEQCEEVDSEDGGNNNRICETDDFPDAITCLPPIDNQNGCMHNVEVRNFLGTGAKFTHASHWIVEDSEFHDMGCLNRGYGFDCPKLVAPDFPPPPKPAFPDYKTDGYGLDVNFYTAYFKVRRNEFYRTLKYGMGFKNGSATGCNGRATGHEVSWNGLHDLGFVGIFSYGATGMRMFTNFIDGTTLFHEPTSWNTSNNTYGLSLGGFCSSDNEFSYNQITNMAGPAIIWNGETQLVECNAQSGCAPPEEPIPGNIVAHNWIDGVCLEKVSAPPPTPGDPDTHLFGAIHTHTRAGGGLILRDNTLTRSECRFVLSSFGARQGVEPLSVWISGGRYESGANAATDSFFYSGALHAHGTGRKIVVDDDTRIVNAASTPIPRVSAAYGATIAIDDDTTDPFAEGLYTPGVSAGNPSGTILECSHPPDPQNPPAECLE